MENPTFETVMKRLRDSFLEMPKAAHRVTPDTKEQEEFIRKYIESKLERTGQGTGWHGKLASRTLFAEERSLKKHGSVV